MLLFRPYLSRVVSLLRLGSQSPFSRSHCVCEIFISYTRTGTAICIAEIFVSCMCVGT